MDRRSLIQGCVATGVLGISGCLESLGFERKSAWEVPPLVENRPAAVYIPASMESMGHFGTAVGSRYAVALWFTFPHRFWIVTGDAVNRVSIEPEDSFHLMCTVWDYKTETILPVDLDIEIQRDQEVIDVVTPWPMISQRMGFHYGDNVELPEGGEYTAIVNVGPLSIDVKGEFENTFDGTETVDFEFEYQRSKVLDLDLQEVDSAKRGTAGAVDIMDGHGHNESNGHGDSGPGDHTHDDHHSPSIPPLNQPIDLDSIDATWIDSAERADANVDIYRIEEDRFVDDSESYLAVFLRTPYNDILLPFASLSIEIASATSTDRRQLTERLDSSLGHHYGTHIPDRTEVDGLEITFDGPPQVTRHEGYETAFLEFDPISI